MKVKKLWKKKTKVIALVVIALALFVVAGAGILGAGFATTATLVSPKAEQQPETNSARVSIDRLPLGDGNVGTGLPDIGDVMVCNDNFGGGGARHYGDWLDKEQGVWDYTEKVKVLGDVAWPNASYSNRIVGDSRILRTNSLPNEYSTGQFPIRKNDPAYEFDTNPNAIGEQDYTFAVPKNPEIANEPTCLRLGPIGVMNDGVTLFNAVDDAGLDAVAHETQDQCDGHPSGDETYHFHNVSNCTVEDNPDTSTLVGYALDGFGIYVERNSDGEVLTNQDLDECHGRVSEIDWDGEQVEMYHYVASLEYPYTIGCYRGTPAQ